MIVAGEVSGDMRAAGLVAAIRRRRPDIRFFGIGGERMREAGVEIWRDARDMAVMGLSDVLARYPFFKRLFVETLALARTRCPDAVILVDYPGFNLRLAARVRALGLKVIYYVCPQVWAWHSARVPAIARSVDRMLALFPFEPDLFRGTGLRVDFVGHPAVDETQAALAQPPEPLPWKGEQPIALLPGSRFHEVQRILPVLWSAAALVERENPAVGFMVAAPSETMERDILRLLAGRRGPSRWALVTGKTLQVLRQARPRWKPPC
jgi:lipid-A-disaccharide synthase